MLTLYIDGTLFFKNMELSKALSWACYYYKKGFTSEIVSELTGEIIFILGPERYVSDSLKYVP